MTDEIFDENCPSTLPWKWQRYIDNADKDAYKPNPCDTTAAIEAKRYWKRDRLKQIRELFKEYPGISQKEIALALGMSRNTVGDYCREIKNEWLAKPNPVYPEGKKLLKISSKGSEDYGL